MKKPRRSRNGEKGKKRLRFALARCVRRTAVALLAVGALAGASVVEEAPGDPVQERHSRFFVGERRAVGQTFVPAGPRLESVELRIVHRNDLRPCTVRLWEWVDANGDGRDDPAEHAATVSRAPLWEDRVALRGAAVPFEVELFAGVAVHPGRLHLLVIEPGDDGSDWGIYGATAAPGEPDPYSPGRLWIGDRPLAGSDLWFRTRSASAASPAVPPVAETAPAWQAPAPPGPPVRPESYLEMIRLRADARREQARDGPERLVREQAFREACLYRATGAEPHAREALAGLLRLAERVGARPETAERFDWLELPGWTYAWIRDSPVLGPDDHRTIRSLLVRAAAALWPEREAGLHNRALAAALGLRLVTALVPAKEAAGLDGVSTADHAAWAEHAGRVEREFHERAALLEDSSLYESLSLRYLLGLEAAGPAPDRPWADPGFLDLVERQWAMHLPLGPLVPHGDADGWGQVWATRSWLFEEAARATGDGRFAWMARRAFDYHRTHLHGTWQDGSRVEPWQALYQEDVPLCFASFAADPDVSPAPPPARAERLAVAFDSRVRPRWRPAGSPGRRTFVAEGGPLVRIDLRTRGTGEVRLKLRRDGDPIPLFDETKPVAGGRSPLSFFPLLELQPGATYTVEASSATVRLRAAASDGDVSGSPGLALQAHTLGPAESTLLRRPLVMPVPVSRWGSPPRSSAFAEQVVPDKLVLRSSQAPDGLHAALNLLASEFPHGHMETGAVLALTDGGSVLLGDSGYSDRRPEAHNAFFVRRRSGGRPGPLPDRVDVTRFVDSRETTVAWLEWADLEGWDVRLERRLYFVKDRLLWVRDRFRCASAIELDAVTQWRGRELRCAGPGWFVLSAARLPGMNEWRFRNPARSLLVFAVPRDGTAFEHRREERRGNPPAGPHAVAQRWSGSAVAGTERWFDSLLLPFGPDVEPHEAGASVRVLWDDGSAVVLRVRIEDETWLLADNPRGAAIALPEIETDAAYAIARSRPGSAPYLLAHRATRVRIPGGAIDASWPVPTSVEWPGTAVASDE